MKTKAILLTILFSCLAFLMLSSKAQAQMLSLSIQPPILQVTMKPGKIITQAYRLKNNGDDTWIYASILPFKPSDNKGNVQLPTNLEAPLYEHPYLAWFSFQNADISLPGRFALKSGQDQQLVLKIRVPENAPEQDYYVSLLFKSDQPISLDNSSTIQAGIIATNILLTTSQTEFQPANGQVELSLKNGLFKLPLVDSLEQLTFLVKTTNTGKFRFQTTGDLKISKKNSIATLPLQPDNVLADSSRTQNVLFDKHKFLLGKYVAQIKIQLPNSESTSAQMNFYAIPYKIILLGWLAIIFGRLVMKSKT